jgi:uncharacterized protein
MTDTPTGTTGTAPSAASTAGQSRPLRTGAGVAAGVGVGLKAPHYRTILERRPAIGFFEVHAENYMGAGGSPHRYLTAIREHYPLSLHGVGLSIGAARPLDRRHLRRLRALLDRYEPTLFSEHLAWSSHGCAFLDDLLPLPYTTETLRRVACHIDQTQEALGRQLLLENPSTYVAFAESSYAEWDFIAEIVRRCGCALLLDVNNLHISCTNQRWDPERYLAHYPLAQVREIHLAGHQRRRDDQGASLLVDTHDRPTSSRVWQLYERVIARLGPVPTLIEWDANVPAWPALAREARHAELLLRAADSSSLSVRRAASPPVVGSAAPIDRRRAAAAAPPLARRQQQFARALLDSSQPVPPGLQGPDGRRCPRRFGVYRNNVAVSLIEALEAGFPAIRRLVGERFFRAMAQAFATTHPPRSPMLWEYGAEFPRFITGFAPAASLPYLADVARIERAWIEAYHAADASVLEPQTLAHIPGERVGAIRFILHPSVRWVRSSYPALTIWRANVARATPPPIDLAVGGEEVLLVRPGAEVQVRALPPGGAVFLRSLARGQVLATAAAAAATSPRSAAPAGRFDLASHLAGLLDSGALESFTLDERVEPAVQAARAPGLSRGTRRNEPGIPAGAPPWP